MSKCEANASDRPCNSLPQEGLDLLEAFNSLEDIRLRQSLIVLAQALALGSVASDIFGRFRPVDG